MRPLGLLLVPLLALGTFVLHLDLADSPPAKAPVIRVNSVASISPATLKTLGKHLPALAADSAQRRAEKMTLRVRNISCSGVAVGSSFAIDRHTLITNRHVIAGAVVLQLNTWDGRSLQVNADTAATGRLVDIGVVTTKEALPQKVAPGPAAKAGDKVTAVGYPLGGALTLSPGRVLGFVDGNTLDSSIAVNGPVMKLSVKIKHGNSGGPLLDSHGRVVGVIYAGEPGRTYTSYARIAYAIPLSTVRKLTRQGGFEPIQPCQGG